MMVSFSIPRLPFKEDKIFNILMLLVFIVPLAFCNFTYEKYETVKISFWLMLLGWALISLIWQKNKKFSIYSNTFQNTLQEGVRIYRRIFLIIGLSLVFGLISTSFSIGLVSSLFGTYPRFVNGIVFYFLWALTFVLLLLILDRSRFKFLLKILFFDALLIAIVGILQSMGIGFYTGLDQAVIDRAPSLLGNPNFSSMFLVSVVPLALPLLKQSKRLPSKIYYLTGIFLIVWAIIVLSSRGAWLGLGCIVILTVIGLLFLRLAKKIYLFVIIAIILGGVLWLNFARISRPNVVLPTLKLTEANISLRLFVWDIARQAAFENPLLGVGPANFQVYYEKHRDKNLADQAGVFDDTHNLFLQMVATTGIPFLFCFLLLIALAAISGLKQLWQRQDFLSFGLLISLFSWVVMASFNPVSSANFLLLAILLTGLYFKQENRQRRAMKDYSVGYFVAVFLGAVCILLGTCFILSEIFFFKAYKDYYANKFADSRHNLKYALYLNPINSTFYAYQAANGIFLDEPYHSLQKKMARLTQLQFQDSKSYLAVAKLFFLLYDKTGNNSYLWQAIEQMDQCLKMDPFFAQRYYRAGFYRAEAGLLNEGLEYVKAGLSLNPKDLPGWLLLARIYQLQNRQKQTLFALEKAYKLRPDNDNIRLLWHYAKNNPNNFKQILIPALIDIKNFD